MKTKVYLLLLLSIYPLCSWASERPAWLTVAFGGDTLFGGYYSHTPPYGTMDALAQMIDEYLKRYGDEEGIRRYCDHALKHIRPIISRAAYLVVNLEGPIVAEPKAFYPKVFPLRQHVRTPEILKEIGVALVSLANNHVYDCNGASGLEETMERLKKAGIDYVGAGKGKDAYAEAFGYKVKETDGVKIAYLGVTDVIEPGDMAAQPGKAGVAAIPEHADYANSPHLRYLLAMVREARRAADFCVVLLHAGPPGGGELDRRQLEIVEHLLAAGVDVIIGTHSHSRQPIKEIKDQKGRVRQIAFYGIGNFLFGGCRRRQGLSIIPLVTFQKGEDGRYLTYQAFTIRPNEDGTFQPIVAE